MLGAHLNYIRNVRPRKQSKTDRKKMRQERKATYFSDPDRLIRIEDIV